MGNNPAKHSQEKKSSTPRKQKQAAASASQTTATIAKPHHHPKLRMDSSAHTFGPGGNASGHYNRHRAASPVMITDALSDVRVNYHIEAKELGHGHYGVVRKCMHRETENWYAIKSIRKSKVSKIEVLKREIEILKEVDHPHIIRLQEVYEDERYLHLITEMCTGGELFDRIIDKTQSVEGHFSEQNAAILVRDILDAIAYCHDQKNIVHRDLKPENFLFLTEADDAPVKIIDFGLSRHDTEIGIMQTKVGTPYYVAPEVLRREYTKSCDVWSIGVITYILLCGYPPFYGDSDSQIFESVKIGKFDFPSPEWDEISSSAKDFIVQMLKKSPVDRPTAARALEHKWFKERLGISQNSNSNGISHKSIRTGVFTKYLALKKLRKAALGYMATNLTQAEVGDLEVLFKAMDTTGRGRITLTELDTAIAQGNFDQRIQADLREMRHDLTVSDEDTINWKDFVASMLDTNVAMRDDNLKLAFESFKHSDAECLTIDDLSDIFGSRARAKEAMGLLDTDGDSKVSYDDFRRVIAESMEEEDSESEFG